MLRFSLAPHRASRSTGLALAATGGTAAWRMLADLSLLGAGTAFLYRVELRAWGLHRLFQPRVWFRHPLWERGLALALLAAAYFPAWLVPHEPDVVGPYPPNPRYPLDSDYEARDRLSRVIFSTRVTLVHIGLDIPAALPRIGARQLARTVSAASPIPRFAFMFIAAIGPGVFILGLGLTGWAHWMRMVGTEVQRIRAEAGGVPPALQFRSTVSRQPEIEVSIAGIAGGGSRGLRPWLGAPRADTSGDRPRVQRPPTAGHPASDAGRRRPPP